MNNIKLSICIATFNREKFIGETLDSILSQVEPGVEVIVVDGASPDNTPDVMAKYTAKYPQIQYIRESVNSGVDADFDKSVSYAKGEFCWLMTDDDLLCPGAIAAVLAAIDSKTDLVIVNAEVRSTDLSERFEKRRIELHEDKIYGATDKETFFVDCAAYLSFIGCVVIRRSLWLNRDRATYYGSLFVHVGVIFQNPPIENTKVIAEPKIIIRYGNAMWTSRSFDVWMFKWPELIWSFEAFSDQVKRTICRQQPWRSTKALFHNRALGAYGPTEFVRLLQKNLNNLEIINAYLVSRFPKAFANLVMVAYFSLSRNKTKMALHDLLFSRNASYFSHLLARVLNKVGNDR